MATAEAETSQDERGAPGKSVYDGFISYSHAADDLLAPRLQTGLQRFAKPWWKRRALRIFRDESSLSANPHLWSSITDALDQSGWFVLLLSPDAAESPWVNNEVEHWLANRDPDRIIPVLTDGEFGWADGDIVSDAAPPALVGAFADEPRWVDLRFARSEEQLDLNNPTFSAAIADIASPIRGIPKDELESEEVRQHRRAIRTAWAGVAALLLLVVVAGATAFYAIGQRDAAQQSEQAAVVSEEAAQQSEQAAVVSEEAAQQGEQEATEFARQVLDHAAKLAADDFVRADSRNIPLPVIGSPPPTPRLTVLFVTCPAHALLDDERASCDNSTVMIHPEHPQSASVWLANEPFHIRQGFVNPDDEPLVSTFRPEFELQVFVTRKTGPPLAEGLFEIGTSYRFTPDYLVRESSEWCGPGFLDQTEPLPCDEFVHEFNEGLPPGSYDIWVEWWAPCATWTTAAVCDDDETPLPLFAERRPDMPFFHDDYTPADHYVGFEGFEETWPYDPWDAGDPLP
jgi:hypothetical protein